MKLTFSPEFKSALKSSAKAGLHIFVAAGLSAVLAWLGHDERLVAFYPVINMLQVLVVKYFGK
jgi:hypothetical protein